MGQKIKVAIIFGGQSPEHEISILSARNVVKALDITKYQAIYIKIAKNGIWQLMHSVDDTNPTPITIDEFKNLQIKVVFPVLHGANGEDGSIQGLLQLLNIATVGVDLLAAAICMDKAISKRLLQQANINIAKFIVYTANSNHNPAPEQIIAHLGLPMFVKPNSAGSSVGVSKVKNAQELLPAIEQALQYDTSVVIEEAIVGRELEVAALGNREVELSVAGEIVLNKSEFYSYAAKYINDNDAEVVIPASLTKTELKELQDIARQAYQALNCNGMARVDLFLTTDGKFYINELNTIPGFTNISMYPKLWEASGKSNQQLVTDLLTLALERHSLRNNINTSYKAAVQV